ncbi:hypothetical protein Trydic_g15031 [Trypoxylus dichotomus]
MDRGRNCLIKYEMQMRSYSYNIKRFDSTHPLKGWVHRASSIVPYTLHRLATLCVCMDMRTGSYIPIRLAFPSRGRPEGDYVDVQVRYFRVMSTERASIASDGSYDTGEDGCACRQLNMDGSPRKREL